MKNLVIFGASGHALVAIDAAERSNEYRIVGIVDSFKTIGTKVLNHEVLGREKDLKRLVECYKAEIFIAIGDNQIRSKIFKTIAELIPKATFATIIHPKSTLGQDIKIGKGSLVLANAVVSPGSILGDFTIINTGAIIEHENVLKDFVSIAPNCTTGGNVIIGKSTFIGIGSVIKNNISVGENCIIGAGSVIVRNTLPNRMYYGVPAREIRLINP